jgi:hypothetical protein
MTGTLVVFAWRAAAGRGGELSDGEKISIRDIGNTFQASANRQPCQWQTQSCTSRAKCLWSPAGVVVKSVCRL